MELTQLPVSPYYCKVNVSDPSIAGFRYGSTNDPKCKLDGEVEDVLFNITAVLRSCESFIHGDSEPNFEFYGQKGFSSPPAVRIERDFSFYRNAIISVEDPFGVDTTVKYNALYDLWSKMRLTTVPTVGAVLSDILDLKFIDNRVLPFHGGVVSRNGKSVVIIGMPDVGKSFTVTRLVRSTNANYISEDLCLIKDGKVSGIPYTETFGKRENSRTSYWEWLVQNTTKYEPYGTNVKNTSLSSDVSYGRRDIDSIYFLENGKNKECNEVPNSKSNDIAKKILALNHMEFGYSKSSLVRMSCIANGQLSLLDIMSKEYDMIIDTVCDNRIVTLKSDDPGDFSDMIRNDSRLF